MLPGMVEIQDLQRPGEMQLHQVACPQERVHSLS